MDQSGFKVLHTLSKEVSLVFYLCFFLPLRRQNVLENPRTPTKMKYCVTDGSGYYPPIEEGLFWIFSVYIEVERS
jgi:hypothetical protein